MTDEEMKEMPRSSYLKWRESFIAEVPKMEIQHAVAKYLLSNTGGSDRIRTLWLSQADYAALKKAVLDGLTLAPSFRFFGEDPNNPEPKFLFHGAKIKIADGDHEGWTHE